MVVVKLAFAGPRDQTLNRPHESLKAFDIGRNDNLITPRSDLEAQSHVVDDLTPIRPLDRLICVRRQPL